MISGPEMDSYLGVPGIQADHVTLVIPDSGPRQEIQLLRSRSATVTVDEGSGNLSRTGFNHVCFRVPDVDAAIDELGRAGLSPRNEAMSFHDRRLGFFDGPSNVVVELAQWI